jgi:chromosome segregation ATPase
VSDYLGEGDQEGPSETEKEIEIDGEAFDGAYKDEVRYIEQASAVDRLNTRITLLAILLPCLIGALVLYGYLDIKKNVAQVKNVGSTEVKALSKDVVEEVSSLSEQYNKVFTSLSDRVATLEASSVIIKEGLEKQRRELEKMGGAKADKEALSKMEEENAETVRALGAVQELLNSQALTLDSLNKALEEEMAGVVLAVEAVRGGEKKRDTEIKKLSEGKMDKKAFDEFLKKGRADDESRLSPLKKEIDSANQGVARLQQQVNMLGRSLQLLQENRTLPDRNPARTSPSGAPTPGKGGIIEQEIAE